MEYVTVQSAPFAKSHYVLTGNCVAIFAHNLALSLSLKKQPNSCEHGLAVFQVIAELLWQTVFFNQIYDGWDGIHLTAVTHFVNVCLTVFI